MSQKGFTLLELQVSISILLFSLTGMGVALMNNMKQVQWLEARRPLYTHVHVLKDADGKVVKATKAIFSEVTSTSAPSGAVNRVRVSSFQVHGSSMTALVTLEAR